MRTRSASSLGALNRIADELIDALLQTAEGASEGALLLDFETRGLGPEAFYGIVAGLEDAGLVRWRGNMLFPALLN